MLEDITRTHQSRTLPLSFCLPVYLLYLLHPIALSLSLFPVCLSFSNIAGLGTATNKSDVSSCGEHQQQPEVPPPASAPVDADEIKANQASHLVNRHMVLPFIPPKFANADSNTLLKPSEYLKSICKTTSKNSLSKARSVIFPVIYNGVYFRLFRSLLRASCSEKPPRLHLVVLIIKSISLKIAIWIFNIQCTFRGCLYNIVLCVIQINEKQCNYNVSHFDLCCS